jgi:DNA-binding NarL/FixJ family response regulator
MTSSVLIADDHRLLTQGLKSLLQRGGFNVIAEANDGRRAVELTQKLKPDVVVMDIGMPGLNGIEATKQICQRLPRAKVIMMSMHCESHFILNALKAGACGYVLKDAAFDELVQALNAVMMGQSYLSPAVARVVVESTVRQLARKNSARSGNISRREREVLQLFSEGKSTKEIALLLYVSVKTIETHRKKMMDRLNVHSIAGLTKYAIREGITSV